jgi:calcium-dependent secretion activator
LNIPSDEAFVNAVNSYYEVFLCSDRVLGMVRSGGCSAADFRDVFKNNIEKRVRRLPEIPGLAKETVISAWMGKFDQIFRGDEDPRRWSQRQSANASESVLSKEQLFDMFQAVLSIKKHDHQILFNAMQVCCYKLDDDAP